MIKATYDTNSLVSGTVSAHGPSSFIIDAWINNDVAMITSEPLIDELRRTLTKPYFTARLTSEQRQAFVEFVRTRATIVPITTPIPTIATHQEDNVVLATAESGHVSYIVTGDHGLQSLNQFKGIHILSPRDFAKLLQEANGGGKR